jgi:hypothetical protein
MCERSKEGSVLPSLLAVFSVTGVGRKKIVRNAVLLNQEDERSTTMGTIATTSSCDKKAKRNNYIAEPVEPGREQSRVLVFLKSKELAALL